jgi:hypothetical protein
MGVFIPFLFFAIMLFYYLHSIWLKNIFPEPWSGKHESKFDGVESNMMMYSNSSYRSGGQQRLIAENI